jgi:hypothetical protein
LESEASLRILYLSIDVACGPAAVYGRREDGLGWGRILCIYHRGRAGIAIVKEEHCN